MLTIPDYQILEQLYESAHSIVYRAHCTPNNTSVILKVLKGEYPTPEQLARFKREYEMTRSLGKIDGIIDVYALKTYNHTLLMELEDFGAESLTRLLPERTLTLREFLRLAIRMTDILGRIHQQHIMHKDINPSNIVWNPETDQLKIIDFGISTDLSREQPDIRNPNLLEGTLAYMSPEQTGRMNRAVDYRSDLYSLGATLYHLLTGHVPFQAEDAMELVHCHLAKMPVPPCDMPLLGGAYWGRFFAAQLPYSPPGRGKGWVTESGPISTHSTHPYPSQEGNSGSRSGIKDEEPIPMKWVGVDTRVPQILSDIILKLMAKNAEDRYQSAFGLKADLEMLAGCTSQIAPHILHFPLAQHDISDRFQIPQKLYGRKQELQTLLQAFDRIANPQLTTGHPEQVIVSEVELRRTQSEMVLVTGYAGIGKTVLVHEIHKPIVEKRGYFISGKFDQFKRNIPYSALIQAFQGFVRQLLSEPEERLALWKEKLLNALGPNGQVIIEVIPELELILGEQPAIPELPPNQAQNRFNFAFQNFVRACATTEHPLVIFLDDLQWSDLPSFKLIELFMTDPRTQCMLIVGAYRDNEVSDAHPLMLTLCEIQNAGAAVKTITVKPLTLEHVNQLLADTLHTTHPYPYQEGNTPPFGKEGSGGIAPLAKLLHQKTNGNPFFLKQFLLSLYEKHLLEFNPNIGAWRGNLEKIRHAEITENVVDLMASKLQQLSEDAQDILKLAACIGNRFDLQTLSIVREKPQEATMHDLHEALQEELIIPLDDSYKYIGITCETPNTKHQTPNTNFKFLHDRVQQAAYSLIKEEQKKDVHLKIGRLLLANTPEAEQEDHIFDIVNHLNLGKDLITAQSEKDELAELNLMAGRRAKNSTAYQAAFRYLRVGIEMLKEDSWQRQYELTLPLHVEAAEAAYLSGDFEQMEQLSEIVLERVKTLLDKVKIYEIKIGACKAQNNLLEAIRTALSVLRLLGVKLPEKPTKIHILRDLVVTKFALAGKQIEDLVNLPEMTDPYKLSVMRILSSAGSAAYFAVPDLVPLLVFKMIVLSIKNGNTSETAFAYAAYGLILCGIMGNIDEGYQFGKLALNVSEQFNAGGSKAKIITVVNTLIRHWKDHARETLQPLLDAYKIGLEIGDLEFAVIAIRLHSFYSCLVGRELTKIEREMTSYSDVMSQLKQETSLNYHERNRQVVLNLLGKSDASSDSPPWKLGGKLYHEKDMLSRHLQANDKTGLWSLYGSKLFLCYGFQAYSEALENAQLTEKYIEGGRGTLGIPLFYCFDSLTRLAVYPNAQKPDRKRHLKKVVANQKKMKKWARHAPMNFLHKWHLVEAEKAGVLGKEDKAIEYYDKAIEGAREHEYLNEEALAHELAAKFYLAAGKKLIARAYMREARYCYLKWGAHAKVQHLDRTYPELLSAPNGHHIENGVHLTKISTLTEADTRILDFGSLMKASQAISGEMVLDKCSPA